MKVENNNGPALTIALGIVVMAVFIFSPLSGKSRKPIEEAKKCDCDCSKEVRRVKRNCAKAKDEVSTRKLKLGDVTHSMEALEILSSHSDEEIFSLLLEQKMGRCFVYENEQGKYACAKYSKVFALNEHGQIVNQNLGIDDQGQVNGNGCALGGESQAKQIVLRRLKKAIANGHCHL